jgi:hypothetical protein
VQLSGVPEPTTIGAAPALTSAIAVNRRNNTKELVATRLRFGSCLMVTILQAKEST